MIIKNYEMNKINLDENKIILFYGKNEGLKNESFNFISKNINNVSNYEEKEILEKPDTFIESILSKSLFDDKKIIVIKRATDRILKILDEIKLKNLEDIIVIISENLDKKSKLRSHFEKSKKNVCIAFYPDNEQTLSRLCVSFFQEKKLSISQSNINLIVNKCGGDREVLFNELTKIELYSKQGKKINAENISKLINLSEDYSVSELIDSCLAKNEKKTIGILNENNFSSEDCVLITRIFINKAKKILKLSIDYKNNNNIELTISNARPPIFWKDKEITKQQIYNWKPENIKSLIYKLNEIELMIKKNLNNAVNIISDFILEQSTRKTNS